jgi:hypothetical protein
MEDVIKLPARYGYEHTLEHIDGNLWQFKPDPKSCGTYRCIGFNGDSEVGPLIYALDPEGGPFLSVDSEVDGYFIKTINTSGIFELVKKQ